MNILNKAKLALDSASGDKIDVIVEKNVRSLTRYANSQIHQNVKKTDGSVRVRVIRNGKTGVANTNSFDDEDIKACAKRAGEIAELSEKNPVDYELPSPAEYEEIPSIDSETANLSPNDRADMVARMVGVADKDNLKIAGAVSNEVASFAVVNNNGVEVEQSYTTADVSVTAMDDDSSGQAERQSPCISDINPVEVAQEACRRAVLGRNPKTIEPGEYEVIMLPYAASEMLRYMYYTGASAVSADAGTSWMDKSLDKKVLSDKLTMVDDPFNPKLAQSKTDAEGFPKKKLTLIDSGKPKNILFNSYYSKKMNRPNTGHATGGYGPFPLHIVMTPGDKSVDEMISTVKKGVLISRFWYTNIMDPMTVQLTTMTRDGLFLIEDGKITSGLKNMRVTDKMLKVFSGIKSVGNEQIQTGGMLTPAYHLDGLNFSGKTKY